MPTEDRTIDEVKRKAMGAAMRVLQSKPARKVLSSRQFQSFVGGAVTTGARVGEALRDVGRAVSSVTAPSGVDDLEALKRELDRRAQERDQDDTDVDEAS